MVLGERISINYFEPFSQKMPLTDKNMKGGNDDERERILQEG